MRCVMPAIQESIEELCQQLQRSRDAETKQRLHRLVLIVEGSAGNRGQAAAHLAVHRMMVGVWLARYVREGLSGLFRRGCPGARARATAAAGSGGLDGAASALAPAGRLAVIGKSTGYR